MHGRKILIHGAEFENKGAEAMIRSVQAGVLNALGDTQGYLCSPRDWDPQLMRGLKRWWYPTFSRPKRLMLSVSYRTGALWLVKQTPVKKQLIGTLASKAFDLDAVLDISGYAYGDVWYRRAQQLNATRKVRISLRRRIMLNFGDICDICRAFSIPILYLPQAWGPFENPMARKHAEKIVSVATKVYARDTTSYNWLRELRSFSEDKVSIGSDIAFAFQGAPPEIGERLLRDLGLVMDGEPIVGVIPNMRVYERTGYGGMENPYIMCLAEAVRYFINQQECQVVLMPHEIIERQTDRPDDRYLCKLVAEIVQDKTKVRCATGVYSAEELKSMIGRTDLLVTSRFHSIVAALSLRRPIVVIAWSHKYDELLKSVGLADFVMSARDMEWAVLRDLCERAWSNREQLRLHLEKTVPAHEKSARQVLAEVVSCIQHART